MEVPGEVTGGVAPEAPIKEKKPKKSKKSPVNAEQITETKIKPMEYAIDIISPVGEIEALSSPDNNNCDDGISLHSEEYEQTVLVEMFVNEVLFYQDPNTYQWFDQEFNEIDDPSI